MERHRKFCELFEQTRRDFNFSFFINTLKTSNIVYYVCFVATNNIQMVTMDNDFISLKSDWHLIKVNDMADKNLTRATTVNYFSGDITYSQFRREMAKAGVFKWVVDLKKSTRLYWSRDNELLYDENITNPLNAVGDAENIH